MFLTCVSTPATASPFYRYQSVTAGYGLPITGDQGIAQLRLDDYLARNYRLLQRLYHYDVLVPRAP